MTNEQQRQEILEIAAELDELLARLRRAADAVPGPEEERGAPIEP